MNWLSHFQHTYESRLTPRISGAKRGLHEGIGLRYPGFRLAFELLIQQNKPWYNIVETGTLRNPGNWKDGQSSVIFTDFVTVHGGTVRSVDIDAAACARAREAIKDQRFKVTASDSVRYLRDLPNKQEVDMWYLDSYDVDWQNDTPSAQHHLNEWLAIQNHIKPGTVIVIDDNARKLENNNRTGKGRMIIEELERHNHTVLYDAYQIVFQA